MRKVTAGMCIFIARCTSFDWKRAKRPRDSQSKLKGLHLFLAVMLVPIRETQTDASHITPLPPLKKIANNARSNNFEQGERKRVCITGCTDLLPSGHLG